MKKIFKKVVVHSGLFHCDDVGVVALCQILAEKKGANVEIVRTFKVTDEDQSAADVLVADIGGGKYDHHQADARRRPDGSPYAAIGLVWEEIGRELVPTEEDWEDFDRNYVRPIEAQDNNGPVAAGNPLSMAISAMNPTWDSEESSDAAFNRAVAFLKVAFQSVFDGYWANARATTIAREAPVVNGTLLTKRFIPVADGVVEGARFHAYPSLRTPGAWNVKVIRHGDILPETPEASFRHKNGFICEFKDRETLDRWLTSF